MATKKSIVSTGVGTSTGVPTVSQDGRSDALRLVAVTATGPVYEGRIEGVVIPISSFLALLQELAAKAADPKAQVVSSLAQRVSGADALEVWDGLGVGFGIWLAGSSREARLAVLSEVLEYVRRQGRVDGLEAAVAAAVNAAWPYVRPRRLVRVLSIIDRAVSKSTFTDKHGVSIVDPIARTLTKVAAGRFKLLDPIGWLDWAELSIPEWRLWLPNDSEWGVELGPSEQELGQLGIGDSADLPGGPGGWGSRRGGRDMPGGPEPQRRPRPRGQAGMGFGNVGTSGGLGGRFGGDSDILGGLGIDGYDRPGPQDLGDLGGGSGRPSFDPGGAGRGIGLGGLGGFGAGPNASGAFGGPLGGRFSGGDFGKPGGPLGFGGGMGLGGASADFDFWEGVETGMGVGLLGGGVVLLLAGDVPAAGVAFAVGFGLISAANHRGDALQHDRERAEDLARHDRERAEDKEAERRREEKRDRERAEDKAAERKKAEEKTKAPTPTPPSAPKQGDKYPDPHKKGGHLPAGDGTVDPIDPRMRPAGDDGLGPNDPRMLPVGDFEHGGDPTTLWEEDGGGVTPTTVGRRMTWTTFGGPGLKAAIVQIDPHTFTF